MNNTIEAGKELLKEYGSRATSLCECVLIAVEQEPGMAVEALLAAVDAICPGAISPDLRKAAGRRTSDETLRSLAIFIQEFSKKYDHHMAAASRRQTQHTSDEKARA